MAGAVKICGICGESRSNMRLNLMTLKTKYSGTSVYQLVERFAEYELSELAASMAESAACSECYAKLNDYDAAYTKALIIQKELLDVLKNSPLGIVTAMEMLDFIENEASTDYDSQQPAHDDEEDVFREAVVKRETETGSPSERSVSREEICWQCKICKKRFSSMEEMDSHKHAKPDIESADEEWSIEPDLLIESVQPPGQGLTDESEDAEEQSVDMNRASPPSLDEEYIVEELEEQENGRAKSNSPVKTNECYYCDEYFTLKESFRAHLEKKHPVVDRQHKCKTCGFVAKTRAALCNHFAKHSRPSLTCDVCHKVFQQKGALQRHVVIHTRETSYHCTLCGKGYIHYSSYYMHLMAHKDVRTQKCNICGFKLRSVSHLKRHMRTHSGEKPFECPDCGQKFSQRYNMITHLNGHRGITRKSPKIYVCRLCQQEYDRITPIRQHLQTQHGISDETEIDHAVLIRNNTANATKR